MGGLIEGIFGKKSSTKGGTIETKSTLTPEQKRVVEALLPEILKGVQSDPSMLESTSLAALEQFALNAVGGDVSEAATEALTKMLTQGPQDFEDFFQTTVQQPALESFQRDIIPQIRTSFAPQFFGGERREAEGRATEDLLESLTRARAGLAFQTEAQNQQNILAALGLAPSIGSLDLQNLIGIGQAQQSLNAQRQQQTQNALAFLGIPQQENIVFAPQQRQGSAGILPGLVQGGALLGGGKAAGLF